MPDRVILNTSCLIALENINQIKLLDDLYQELIIPTAVKEEFGSPQINNLTLVTVSLSLAELLEQELARPMHELYA